EQAELSTHRACLIHTSSASALRERVGKRKCLCQFWASCGEPWPTELTVVMLSAKKDGGELLLVSSSLDINGSVLNDTIVERNCVLHIRGNLKGSLTIEPGANVVVEGSVDGKVIN